MLSTEFLKTKYTLKYTLEYTLGGGIEKNEKQKCCCVK